MSFFLKRGVGACVSRVRVYRISRSPDAPLARIVPDTIGRYPARGRVLTTSVGVTRPSSLVRAHAPDHDPPTAFGCPSVRGSVQVGASPCWDVALPGVPPRIFPRMLGPIPRRFPWCIRPFLPRGHRPSPCRDRLGTPHDPYRDFRTGDMTGLQSFADVQASGFARHAGRSCRSGSFSTGQPWLLRPSL